MIDEISLHPPSNTRFLFSGKEVMDHMWQTVWIRAENRFYIDTSYLVINKWKSRKTLGVDSLVCLPLLRWRAVDPWKGLPKDSLGLYPPGSLSQRTDWNVQIQLVSEKCEESMTSNVFKVAKYSSEFKDCN